MSHTIAYAANAAAFVAINALWQDALLLGCVWLVLRLWPGVNAVTRCTVWMVALVAMAVMPLATTRVVPSTQAASVRQRVVNAPVHVSARAARGFESTIPPAQRAEVRERGVAPAWPRRARVSLPLAFSLAICAAWIALSGLLLLRLAVALVRLERLKRDALPLALEDRDALPRWNDAEKGARSVRLCVSDDTDVPVAVGLFDSMILIPQSLLQRLSHEEIDQIVLHELAHLRRGDDWSNGVQRVLVALLAWNPAVQLVARQLDLEREVACDDWVLSQTHTVRPYAMCLTKMAETAAWPHQPVAAPGVFTTRRSISLRIERLLAAGRDVATHLSPGPSACAAAAIVALALFARFAAPVVAAPSAPYPIAAATASPATARLQTPAPVHAATAVPVKHPAIAQATSGMSVAFAPTASRTSAPSPSPTPHERMVHVAGTHVHVPAQTIRIPAIDVDVPARTISVPSIDAKGIENSITQSVDAAMKTARAAMNACTGCSATLGGSFQGVNWSGRDLHGVAYTGVDLSRATLVDTNFGRGSFNGVDFSHADLRGANFKGATLIGVDFSRARLDGATFAGATLTGCDFSGVDLTHVDLSNAKMIDSDLSEPARR